jgi:hypothetical protein
MADEISHSDIVYTFFHPLLRDQQEANINATKVKGNFMCIIRTIVLPPLHATTSISDRRIETSLIPLPKFELDPGATKLKFSHSIS